MRNLRSVALCTALLLLFAIPTAASAEIGALSPVYGSGVGDLGGEQMQPSDAAADAAGDLYVADSVQNRISVFSAGGAFQRAFGFDVIPGNPGTGFEVCTTSCKIGTAGGGGGQLNFPASIDVDGSDLYVADRDNNRISVFTTQGAFLRAFGFNVVPGGGSGFEACTSNCQAGTAGDAPGQLSDPSGVVSDGSGNVFVTDGLNQRISVFGAQGSSFERAFGANVVPGGGAESEVCTTSCQAGVAGNGIGQLNNPSGVAAACGSQLYVSEATGARVQRFGEPGTPLPPCASPPTEPPVNPPVNPPPSDDQDCEKARSQLDKAKAKLKKLKKNDAAKAKVSKAKAKVKKAKAKVKREC